MSCTTYWTQGNDENFLTACKYSSLNVQVPGLKNATELEIQDPGFRV
jgi:hypothetical protein